MAMTQRERYLAMGVGVVVGLFALQYVANTLRDSLQAKQDLIDAARNESDEMKRVATSGQIAARKLDQLKLKSLPTRQETLVAQYKGWLTKAALDAGVTEIKVTPPERPVKETQAYKAYKFTLSGECRTDQWLDLLANYFDADYLHSVQTLKVTMTKVPNVIKITLDSHVLALDAASADQAPSGLSSGRLALPLEEYKKIILGRNPFSPPNQPPSFANQRSFEIPRDAPWEQIIQTEDVENHEVSLSLVSESLPEGLTLNGKTFHWTPKANGEFEVLVKATDNGWPNAHSQEKLTIRVVDPPKPAEPTPEPPKFDVATQAFVSALVSGRSGPEVWIRSRVEGKMLELAEGQDFEIGSVKAKVIGINLNEDFVELESDGIRWTMGMDTSLADAYAKSKID